MTGPAPSVLHAETGDVRPLARLLRGIGLKHNATIQISKAGFEVVVEEGRTLSATAFIPQTLFRVYKYNHSQAADHDRESTPDMEDDHRPFVFHSIEVSIDAWLQCLNIFGDAGAASTNSVTFGGGRKRDWAGEADRFGEVAEEGNESRQRSSRPSKTDRATSMSMDWQGPGFPLVLLLLQDPDGPVTRCELKTLEPEDFGVDGFNEEEIAMQVIMKSSWFREALLDLPPSSTKLTLIGSPVITHDESQVFGEPSRTRRSYHKAAKGVFKLRAVGTFGYTELDYPNDASVIEKFECMGETSFGYHASHFALLARALQHSPKVSIRIETTGFLSVQCLMPDPEGMPKPPPGENSGIIEFKMHALQDDEESE